MKKVGICTLHDAAPNFGATLQAFCMQQVVKDLGYEVEFLKFKEKSDFVSEDEININENLKKSNIHLNVSKKIYNPEEDKYDSIIIGSDELWNVNNPSFEHRREYYGFDLNCDNILAYAPSCNTTTIEEFHKFHNREVHFDNIKHLSARDLNTKSLLEEMTSRDVTLVLDPTMLIDDVTKFAKLPPEKDYILLYDYRVRGKRKELLLKLSKEKNLPIYAIGFYCDFADKNIDADIFEFIGYMLNATYVVTATFHGTVFSILTKKQFASYAFIGYKIQDILNRMELVSQDATNAEDLALIVDNKIDYEKVDEILNRERKISLDYLKNALGHGE